MKKCLFTLNVDNYAPEICELTYPLLKAYADKIGAEFFVIKDRKFPDWPVVYEKFQIYELAPQMGNDWNIYVDSDALLHPDLPDFTEILSKDTVAHHGHDFAPIRWKYDRFFRRDGRHIGSGNWFTIGSDWCLELWKPLDDLTFEEAVQNIRPTVQELNSGVITPEHLIDDYTCSRNIAKYGLKFVSIRRMLREMDLEWMLQYFYHQYVIPPEAKVAEMKQVLRNWGL